VTLFVLVVVLLFLDAAFGMDKKRSIQNSEFAGTLSCLGAVCLNPDGLHNINSYIRQNARGSMRLSRSHPARRGQASGALVRCALPLSMSRHV
jgi:hypothetical protein